MADNSKKTLKAYMQQNTKVEYRAEYIPAPNTPHKAQAKEQGVSK
jgi:hypothetical protein